VSTALDGRANPAILCALRQCKLDANGGYGHYQHIVVVFNATHAQVSSRIPR